MAVQISKLAQLKSIFENRGKCRIDYKSLFIGLYHMLILSEEVNADILRQMFVGYADMLNSPSHYFNFSDDTPSLTRLEEFEVYNIVKDVVNPILKELCFVSSKYRESQESERWIHYYYTTVDDVYSSLMSAERSHFDKQIKKLFTKEDKIFDVDTLLSFYDSDELNISEDDTFDSEESPEDYAQFVSNLNMKRFEKSTVLVGRKIPKTMQLYGKKTFLEKVDSDLDVAFDKVMLFLSLIRPLGQYDESYTNISSRKLEKMFGAGKYSKIIDYLKFGTKFGAIIESDDEYHIGGKCKGYRITYRYRKGGFVSYEFKTDEVKTMYMNLYMAKYSDIYKTNAIVRKIVSSYQHLRIPTLDEVVAHAKKLVDEKYTTPKGKRMVFVMTKKSRSFMYEYYKRTAGLNPDEIVFADDSIEIYKALLEGGFLIPTVGDEKSGYRVYDSFALLPSWIRKLCILDGEKMTTFDYSALHPNIALVLYGTHDEQEALGGDMHSFISTKMNLDRKDVKVEHLSFFNKTIYMMKQSPLWNFYQEYAPTMLGRIVEDKAKYGYKVTSRKMFAFETALMTKVIEQLPQDTPCLYVFDALYATDRIVGETMNRVAESFGLRTSVDIPATMGHKRKRNNFTC